MYLLFCQYAQWYPSILENTHSVSVQDYLVWERDFSLTAYIFLRGVQILHTLFRGQQRDRCKY